MRRALVASIAVLFLAAPAQAETGGLSDVLHSAGRAELPAGQVGANGWVLRAPVRHAITATLSETLVNPAEFASNTLEAGQYLYGVPMAGSFGGGMTWCAPAIKRAYGFTNWHAICLMPTRFGWAWVETLDGLFVQEIRFPGIPPVLEHEPRLDRSNAEWAVVPTVEYRLIEWDSNDIDLRVYILADGARERIIGDLSIPRNADGTVSLIGMGGEIRISQPGTDRRQAVVEEVRPTVAGAPLFLPVNRP